MPGHHSRIWCIVAALCLELGYEICPDMAKQIAEYREMLADHLLRLPKRNTPYARGRPQQSAVFGWCREKHPVCTGKTVSKMGFDRQV